jgi:hypothetical protein
VNGAGGKLNRNLPKVYGAPPRVWERYLSSAERPKRVRHTVVTRLLVGCGSRATSRCASKYSSHRSGIGFGAPYELLASAGQRIVAFKTFNTLSPIVFFGGAALALVISLPALVRVRAKVDSGLVTISSTQVRTQRLPLILAATALISVAILLTYVAVEQVRSVAV